MKSQKTKPAQKETKEPQSMSYGQCIENPVIISTNHVIRLIELEYEFINRHFKNIKWRKHNQSIFIENNRRYDKITVVYFPSDEKDSYMDFWFDTTNCF